MPHEDPLLHIYVLTLLVHHQFNVPLFYRILKRPSDAPCRAFVNLGSALLPTLHKSGETNPDPLSAQSGSEGIQVLTRHLIEPLFRQVSCQLTNVPNYPLRYLLRTNRG